MTAAGYAGTTMAVPPGAVWTKTCAALKNELGEGAFGSWVAQAAAVTRAIRPRQDATAQRPGRRGHAGRAGQEGRLPDRRALPVDLRQGDPGPIDRRLQGRAAHGRPAADRRRAFHRRQAVEPG